MGALHLQPGVGLWVTPDALFLSRDGVAVEHPLGVAEALALGLLNASGSAALARDEMDRLVADGAAWVDRVVSRYWTYLGEGTARPLDMAWATHVAGSRPRPGFLPMSRIRIEAAPASVTWMVTLGCNRGCPYCFFDVFPHRAGNPVSPPDATFPLEAAVRMVREMAAIGAADLYLTGGEPLLRVDLPEIIAEASLARVRCHLVTKYPIDRSLARRLASAGLNSLSFSLDDARPRQAAALAGSAGFLGEAEQAIEAVRAEGIPIEVNAVVTAVNAAHLDALAEALAERGVPRLRVSPLSPTFPSRPGPERLAKTVAITPLVTALAARHGHHIEVVAGSGAVAEAGDGARSCGATAACEVGTRALDVLPDGSVSRCHYLPGRPQMVVGSLLESTLLEVWRGDRLGQLVRPERAAYSGTACGSCSSLEGCHSRGRCYVSALSAHGRPFAPDQFCTQ